MKATIEFTLPDDKRDHEVAVHGMDWALLAWDLDQEIRRYLKHVNDFKSPDEALETIRSFLYDTMRRSASCQFCLCGSGRMPDQPHLLPECKGFE